MVNVEGRRGREEERREVVGEVCVSVVQQQPNELTRALSHAVVEELGREATRQIRERGQRIRIRRIRTSRRRRR